MNSEQLFGFFVAKLGQILRFHTIRFPFYQLQSLSFCCDLFATIISRYPLLIAVFGNRLLRLSHLCIVKSKQRNL